MDTSETVPCNRCGKSLDRQLVEHYRNLPLMMGYNCIPDEFPCIVCCRAVCKDCMWGLGMFNFICREQCKPAWDIYQEDSTKPAKIAVARQRVESGDDPVVVACDLRVSFKALVDTLKKNGFDALPFMKEKGDLEFS